MQGRCLCSWSTLVFMFQCWSSTSYASQRSETSYFSRRVKQVMMKCPVKLICLKEMKQNQLQPKAVSALRCDRDILSSKVDNWTSFIIGIVNKLGVVVEVLTLPQPYLVKNKNIIHCCEMIYFTKHGWTEQMYQICMKIKLCLFNPRSHWTRKLWRGVPGNFAILPLKWTCRTKQGNRAVVANCLQIRFSSWHVVMCVRWSEYSGENLKLFVYF